MEATREINRARAEGAARSQLRQATRAAHVRLEQVLELTSPALTRAAYGETLRRFRTLYGALELHVDGQQASLDRCGLGWAARRKTGLLDQDLRALGLSAAAAPPALADALARELGTLPRLMGCLYVVEGATLGGAIIAKHLARTLGIGPDDGAAFFSGYGGATMARWQDLCGLLEASLPNPAARDDAVAGANATFEMFLEHVAPRPS